MSLANPRSHRPTWRLATLLTLALAACAGPDGPSLDAVTVGNGQAFAVVGQQQRLIATAHYSDGSTAELHTGITWSSSDPSLVSVDDTGLLTPWAKGAVVITARHAATGVEGQTGLTSRLVVTARAGQGPVAGHVDTDVTYYRLTGLTPGTFYTPVVSGMSDDVDIAVYSDVSLAPETLLCDSMFVGDWDEWCIAPANAEGELWLVVDGEWTRAGASYAVDAPASQGVTLATTLAFPAALPYTGTVGPIDQFLKVTGLTPGKAYEVKLSQLTADLDLAVYGDPFQYAVLCVSYLYGTGDDACDARANAAGELILEIDGRTSLEGGSYSLSVAAR